MTAFTKDNLVVSGIPGDRWVHYHVSGEHGKAVARFKHGATASAATFKTFLIKNFTVEEYFARKEADEAPLKIAESKGYMLAHIRKWLRQAGYPLTKDGLERYMAEVYRPALDRMCDRVRAGQAARIVQPGAK